MVSVAPPLRVNGRINGNESLHALLLPSIEPHTRGHTQRRPTNSLGADTKRPRQFSLSR